MSRAREILGNAGYDVAEVLKAREAGTQMEQPPAVLNAILHDPRLAQAQYSGGMQEVPGDTAAKDITEKIRPLTVQEFLARAETLADSMEKTAADRLSEVQEEMKLLEKTTEARIAQVQAQQEEMKFLADNLRDLARRYTQFDTCVAEARTRFLTIEGGEKHK